MIRIVSDRLTDIAATVGAVGLVAVMAVILVDVVGRAFGAPLTGAQDVATMTLVIVVFGGMALCDRLGGHVAVDVLEPLLPRWLVRAGDAAGAFLGAAIFIAIAWAVIDSAALSRMLNLSTNIVGLPKAWFQYAMVAFSLVTALTMILRGVGVYRTRASEPARGEAL